jgi:hypothetical protein
MSSFSTARRNRWGGVILKSVILMVALPAPRAVRRAVWSWPRNVSGRSTSRMPRTPPDAEQHIGAVDTDANDGSTVEMA